MHCVYVLNSLILKTNDAPFCCNFSQFLNVSTKSVLYMKHPQITEIGTGKICGRTGKQNLSGDPVLIPSKF